MRLVVDVGNTETVVGLIEGRTDLCAHWRLSTAVPRTVDEYRHLLGALLREAGEAPPTEAVVASVVPDVTAVLLPTLSHLVDGLVRVVQPDSKLPVQLDVEEPRTVGGDRIVNTLAARELYGRFNVFYIGSVWHGMESIPSKKPLRSVDDLKGVKMRIPEGLNQEIFNRIGAAPVNI